MITQTLHELRRRGGGFGFGHGLRGWRSWRGDGSGGGIMTTTSAFMLNVRLDNVAVVAIDVHGEKVNTLKAEFAAQVRAILKQIRENKALQGVVLSQPKQITLLLALIST